MGIRSGPAGIHHNHDLGTASAAAVSLLVHAGCPYTVRQHGPQDIQHKRKGRSLPITHRQHTAGLLDGARIVRQIALIIKSAGIGQFLPGQPGNLQLSVGILGHGHVQLERFSSVRRRHSHDKGVVAQTAFPASPWRHTGLCIGPHNCRIPLSCSVQPVGAAPHPVGGIPDSHHADAVLIRQLHGPVRAVQGVQDAGPHVSIINPKGAKLPLQGRLSIYVHPAFLNVIYKPGHPVGAVRIYPVVGSLRVNTGAGLRLFLRHPVFNQHPLNLTLNFIKG